MSDQNRNQLIKLLMSDQLAQDQDDETFALTDKQKKELELLADQQEYAQQLANRQTGGQVPGGVPGGIPGGQVPGAQVPGGPGPNLLQTIDPQFNIPNRQFSANVPGTPLRVSGSPFGGNQNIGVRGRIPF
jgi:hypothetical protein